MTTMLQSDPRDGAIPRATKSGARIKVDSVSHAFSKPDGAGDVVALNDVSLEIPPGQFVALVGPSGCGKTTVLNMIAGLMQPLAGQVLIDTDPIVGPSRHTGYMFARDGLLPWRNAQSNVEAGLTIRGMGRGPRRDRAKEMLELVGLGEFGESYPRQLSQGMRQRVAIARTLAMDPDTLLMDEPFAALDAQTKLRVQAEFINIWEGSGKTVVFVTHDLSEAVLLADRIIVFAPRPGRIVHDIEVSLPRPRNIETLRFDKTYEELHERLWHALKMEESDEH